MWKRRLEDTIKFLPRLLRRVWKSKYIKTKYLLSKEFNKLQDTKGEKRIILMGTPEHKNLGDHAISEAELSFFSDFSPDLKVVEIGGNEYRNCNKTISRFITKEDIIVITGGGSMGTLWLSEEYMIRNIVKSHPNNKIIIFPQTLFYENDSTGNYELNASKNIYQSHPNLYICVRDQNSYDFVCENNLIKELENCLLVPDIVTYLNKTNLHFKRNGVLICFRKDKESRVSNTIKDSIVQNAYATGEQIMYTDTIASKIIKRGDRIKELDYKFNEFSRAKLVITDRLHGMIFAAITGTPCIALNNVSGKVEGVYNKWIKHLKYIHFTDNINEISPLIDELLLNSRHTYDNKALFPYFKKIAHLINK